MNLYWKIKNHFKKLVGSSLRLSVLYDILKDHFLMGAQEEDSKSYYWPKGHTCMWANIDGKGGVAADRDKENESKEENLL